MQGAKEQFGSVEPRAVLRGEMKDMAVAGVTQKSPVLNASFELFRLKLLCQ